MKERALRRRFALPYCTIIEWLAATLFLLGNVHSLAENRALVLDFAAPGHDKAAEMQGLFRRPPSEVELVLDASQDEPMQLSLKSYRPFKVGNRTLLDGRALTDSELGAPKQYFRGEIKGVEGSFAFLSIEADGEASLFADSPFTQIKGKITGGVFYRSNSAPAVRTGASSVSWPNNDAVTLPSLSPPEPPSAAQPAHKSRGGARSTTTQTIEMDVAQGWYGWGRSITVPPGQARVGILNRGPGVAVVYVSSDPNFANVDYCGGDRCFIENPVPGEYYVRAYKFDATSADWIPDLPSEASYGFSEELGEGELYLATIAVELDDALYAQMGSVTAITDYLAQLMAYNSATYEKEAYTQLQIGDVILYTNDPYPFTQDSGARLSAVSDYWQENGANVDRSLLMHLSADVNNGGIASLNTLCSLGGGYSVSGVDGLAPADELNINWDGFVTAHELGHNFGAPHTHCFAGLEGNSSPIDGCYVDTFDQNACFQGTAALPGLGALLGGSAGSQNGTIMSYCHVLDGGLSNIARTFGLNHPYGVDAGRVPTLMARITSQVATAAPECLSGFAALPEEEPISSGLPVWLLYQATQQ